MPQQKAESLSPTLKQARKLTERESVTFLTGRARKRFIELMERTAPSEKLIRNLHDTRHEIVE